ncbi:hypothetical protein SAMN04515674_11992 [Pseudarcicella hirudinis]|uniref:Uncharacterized protein n=1 Tax=Pseudarcicella hirudinis TaxID=1079859 RepID=A0A1I5YKY8_9BACT|nr:hypothetical protein SAMN04515674_11992 [Pseudarcicella hirudinis]
MPDIYNSASFCVDLINVFPQIDDFPFFDKKRECRSGTLLNSHIFWTNIMHLPLKLPQKAEEQVRFSVSLQDVVYNIVCKIAL